MKLLSTYEDHDDAKEAESLIFGQKRLASERDGTVTIYNLFGQPTWRNFHSLKMYRLHELKILIESRGRWDEASIKRHCEIISQIKIIAKNNDLTIPHHWL